MVSLISATPEPAPTPPRGARMLRTPYAIAVVVLLLLALAVWGTALTGDDADSAAVACPAPPEGTSAGLAPQSSDSLDDVAPSRLSEARFRVLNANGQSGQAGAVAAQLGELGFKSVGETAVGNDTVYTGQDLQCHGQIRFGDTGRAAARSLSFAAPCMELVSDHRTDATVDLVLGQTFAQLTQSNAALGVLDRLKAGTPPEQSQLQAARSVNC